MVEDQSYMHPQSSMLCIEDQPHTLKNMGLFFYTAERYRRQGLIPYKPVFYAEHRRPTPYSLEYGVAKGLG
jgi:hypothetical protein